MKINIIKIDRTEYIEIKHKADKYDELKNKRVEAGKKSANKLSTEQRVDRARHAAQARWSK